MLLTGDVATERPSVQRLHVLPGLLGDDASLGVLPLLVELSALEESVEEHGESGDLAVWLVGDGDVDVRLVVHLERHLLPADDHEERFVGVGSPDVVLDVLDAFAVHREVDDRPRPVPDERVLLVRKFDVERAAEPARDILDGLMGLARVRGEDDAIRPKRPRGQPDVRSHPVVAPRSVAEPTHDDGVVSLHDRVDGWLAVTGFETRRQQSLASSTSDPAHLVLTRLEAGEHFYHQHTEISTMRTRGSRAEAIAGVDRVDLTGQTAVVTGGTGDIGREIALALARLGADLHVQGRDTDRGAAVVDEIEAAGVDATFHETDFLDIDQINDLGETLVTETDGIDILVLNAGAHFQDGRLTEFGLERTFQVNHFAPFLLTEYLRSELTDAGRVVVVASEVHRRGELEGSFSAAADVSDYDGFQQYSNSKLANVLYANALSRRLDQATANSCHPGFVPSSGLWRHSRLAVRGLMGLASVLPQGLVNSIVDTPVQAAATPVYLAASEECGERSGCYFEDCAETQPSELGRDTELAEALWSWSQAQLGVPSDA